MKQKEWQHLTHGFGPLFNEDSEILILGSFPSVKSREQAFFYGHPQNRFWKIISAVFGETVPGTGSPAKKDGRPGMDGPSRSGGRPEAGSDSGEDVLQETIAAKKALILRHHLALYDVIEECEIMGSADSSIRNVVPADLRPILQGSKVERIFVNGKTAGKYYEKYLEPVTGIRAGVLPSSSPANAAWSLEMLTEAWGQALKPRA